MENKQPTNRAVGGFGEKKPPVARTAGNDYLLLIGIDDYVHFPKLNNAVKDVNDIGGLLTSTYGFKAVPPYFNKLINQQATRQNIIKTLNALTLEVTPGDRVLIYYSGHGYLNQKKRGFWIPIEGEEGDESGFVSNADIRNLIADMNSRHTLLVSDSCFSGSLVVREAKQISGSYQHWENEKSRWLFCSGKGVVSDGDTNSPFAEAIIKLLTAEKDGDPVNIAYLADNVTKKVGYNHLQVAEAAPLHGAGHEGGQFIFYKDGIIPPMLPKVRPPRFYGRGTAETPNPPSIDVHNFVKTQRTLIGKAKIGKVFQNLTAFLESFANNGDLQNDLVKLNNRSNRLEKDVRMGVIRSSDENLERNKITAALLHFLEDIEDELG